MGRIKIGIIGLTDKDKYDPAKEYNYLHMVTTEDSCYYSKKNENKGHPVTDTEWWACMANGKPATEAAGTANAAAKRADTATSDCNAAIGRTATAIQQTEEVRTATEATKKEAEELIARLGGIVVDGEEVVANLRAIEEAIVNQAQLVPTSMELEYEKKITFRRTNAKSIKARLLPSYVKQNLLYLVASGDSLTVNPLGYLEPQKEGKTKIYVIPTNNTSLMQTIEIDVVVPGMRKYQNTLRLTSNGAIRLT